MALESAEGPTGVAMASAEVVGIEVLGSAAARAVLVPRCLRCSGFGRQTIFFSLACTSVPPRQCSQPAGVKRIVWTRGVELESTIGVLWRLLGVSQGGSRLVGSRWRRCSELRPFAHRYSVLSIHNVSVRAHRKRVSAAHKQPHGLREDVKMDTGTQSHNILAVVSVPVSYQSYHSPINERGTRLSLGNTPFWYSCSAVGSFQKWVPFVCNRTEKE